MYEFLVSNSIFVVLIISLIIWIGISFFLFMIDNKISKLEDIINKNKELENNNKF